jgi:hypothetical protein
MRRTGVVGGLALLVALGCGEPSAHEDPCLALRVEYDAVRARVRCTSDAECVAAPGLGPAREPGQMGEPPRPPCGSATHGTSLSELEAVIDRWRAAGCGPVGAPGSRSCSPMTHGASVACTDGRCTAVF